MAPLSTEQLSNIGNFSTCRTLPQGLDQILPSLFLCFGSPRLILASAQFPDMRPPFSLD